MQQLSRRRRKTEDIHCGGNVNDIKAMEDKLEKKGGQ